MTWLIRVDSILRGNMVGGTDAVPLHRKVRPPQQLWTVIAPSP